MASRSTPCGLKSYTATIMNGTPHLAIRTLVRPIRLSFITQGMMGTGIFGILLNKILLSPGATFSYRGEDRIEGRKAVRYDYRWPRVLGGFEIQGVTWGGKAPSVRTPNRWILSVFSRTRWKCQRVARASTEDHRKLRAHAHPRLQRVAGSRGRHVLAQEYRRGGHKSR